MKHPSDWASAAPTSARTGAWTGALPPAPAGGVAFACDDCPPGSLLVTELRGTEALGEPFEFELTLMSPRCDLDARAMLHRHACVYLLGPDPHQPPVPYHGVLACFEQLHGTDSHTLYRNCSSSAKPCCIPRRAWR